MGDESTHVGCHTRQANKHLTDARDRSRTISHRLITQLQIHMADVHSGAISITRRPAGSHLHPLHIVAGLELLGEKSTRSAGHLERDTGIEHHRVHQ